MDEVLRQFREAAQRAGAGAGRKFPAEIKELGARYARSRRQAGASWQEIAKELGVVVPTVLRWAKRPDGNAVGGSFHQVSIVEPKPRGTYAAVFPAGLRIEGLELEAVIALARALS